MTLPPVGVQAVVGNLGGFRAAVGSVVAGLNEMNRATLQMASTSGGAWSRAALAAAGGQRSITGSAARISAAVATVVAAFKGFEAVNKIQSDFTRIATIDNEATADSMRGLTVSARALGLAWGQTMTEMAQASLELNKAGLGIQDITAGASRAVIVLEGAAAGELSLARASEIVAQGMTTFGVAAEDAMDVVRSITGAANSSTSTFENMANAYQIVGNTIGVVGGTMDDVGILMGILANNSIRGSNAGTSLRSTFQALIAPSKEALEVMKQYNLSLFDAQGNVVGVRNFLAQLESKFSDTAIAQGKLTEADRAYALATLFRTRSLNTAVALANAGTKAYDEFAAALANTDPIAQARAQVELLGGRLGQLRAFISVLNETFLGAASSGIANFVEGINALLFALNQTETIEAFGAAIGQVFSGEGFGRLIGLIRGQLGPGLFEVFDAAVDVARTFGGVVGSVVLPNLLAVYNAVQRVVVAQGGWASVVARVGEAFTTAIGVIGRVFGTIIGIGVTVLDLFSRTAVGVQILSMALQSLPVGIVIALLPALVALSAPLVLLAGKALLVTAALAGITAAAQFLAANVLPNLRPLLDFFIKNLPTAIRVAQVAVLAAAAVFVGPYIGAALGAARASLLFAATAARAAVMVAIAWATAIPGIMAGLGNLTRMLIATAAAATVAALRIAAAWLTVMLPGVVAAVAGSIAAMTPLGLAVAAVAGASGLALIAWQNNWFGIQGIVAKAVEFITQHIDILLSAISMIPGVGPLARAGVMVGRAFAPQLGGFVADMGEAAKAAVASIGALGEQAIAAVGTAMSGALNAVDQQVFGGLVAKLEALNIQSADQLEAWVKQQTAALGVSEKEMAENQAAVGKWAEDIAAQVEAAKAAWAEFEKQQQAAQGARGVGAPVGRPEPDELGFPPSDGGAGPKGRKAGAGDEPTKAEKLKELIALIQTLLADIPLMNRELAEFIANIAIEEPARLLPMIGAIRDQKGAIGELVVARRDLLAVEIELARSEATLNQLNRAMTRIDLQERRQQIGFEREMLGIKMALLDVDRQLWPLEDALRVIDRQIAALQRENFALARARITTELELLPVKERMRDVEERIAEAQKGNLLLAARRAVLENSLLPLRQGVAAIDRAIADANKENYQLTLARVQAELSILPALQQIAAIDRAIGKVQRDNHALTLERLLAEQDIIPMRRAVEDIERRITDLVDRRAQLEKRRETLVAEGDVAAIKDQIETAMGQLEDAWQDFNVPEILRLEALKEQLEAQLRPAEDRLRQIGVETDEQDRLNEIREIGLQLEIEAINATMRPLEDKLLLIQRTTEDEKLRTDITVTGYQLEKDAIQLTIDSVQDYLVALKNEIDTQQARTAIVVAGLNIEKALLEALFRPWEDKLIATQNEIAAQEARNAVTKAGLELERALIDALMAPLKAKLTAIEIEQSAYDLRNRIAILGLQEERLNIELQMQPLEDKRRAIEREQRQIEALQLATKIMFDEQRLQIEAAIIEEKLRQMELEDTEAQIRATYNTLILQFLKAMNQSGAFSLDEAQQVLQRLGLWDQQAAKIGESTAAMSRLDAEAKHVRDSINSIPKDVTINITTVHRERREGGGGGGDAGGGGAGSSAGGGNQQMATGGIAWSRGWRELAEYEPELVIPFSRAHIPTQVTRAVGGGGGGTVVNNNYDFHVNANYERRQSPASIGMDLRAVMAQALR